MVNQLKIDLYLQPQQPHHKTNGSGRWVDQKFEAILNRFTEDGDS
jgi:hypothetical protein